MKKLESFLSKYSWQLMLGMVVLFLFWAVKVHVPFVSFFRFGYREGQISRNQKVDIAKEREAYTLLQRMEKEAQVRGAAYGPKEYFADLEHIENFSEGYPVTRFSCDPMRLQRFMLNNIDNHLYSMKDLEKARAPVEKRRDERRAMRNFFIVEPLSDCTGFKSWAIELYLKGMFLFLLWYLIVMAERRGILRTVLAEKKLFMYALVLWPFYWLKYPAYTIREIVVEAELRRLGRPFRKLSEAEQKLIKRIARSAGYREWRIDFSRENQGRFQRGFKAALIITLLIYLLIPTLLVPVKVEASGSVRAGPTMIVCQVDTHHSGINLSTPESLTLPESFYEDFSRKEGAFESQIETLVRRVFASNIEHVPLIRLFGLGYFYQPTT